MLLIGTPSTLPKAHFLSSAKRLELHRPALPNRARIRAKFSPVMLRPAFGRVLSRALRLRCPNCGEGRLFRGIFAVRDTCALCGLPFFRESGYFIVSMYINVILTEAIMVVAYVVVLFLPTLFHLSWPIEFALWMFAAVVVSLSLTRWTRSAWLAFDFWLEPWSPPLLRIIPSGPRGSEL